MTQSAETWTDRLRLTLASYDDGLLRRVSGKLCKPRNHWPAQELIDRCLATLTNVAVLDRRLKDLETPSRLALALMAHSRQNVWSVGSLVEMLVTLGHTDGLGAVQSLLEAGLLFPKLFPLDADRGEPLAGKSRLREFDYWLSLALPPMVCAHPAVMERALGALESLPDCPGSVAVRDGKIQEADGLEWPLRLAVLWQKVAAVPLRRTQQHDFFKRDLDRIQDDPLLNLPPNESLALIPDIGLFTVALGLASGVVAEEEGEIRAGVFPAAWSAGLAPALASLWSAAPRLESWNPAQGWNVATSATTPYPSVYLLSLLLLGRLPENRWAAPSELEKWLVKRHPYWNPGSAISLDEQAARVNGKARRAPVETNIGLTTFLLGVAFPLRLLEVAKDSAGAHVVRLSSFGRWALGLAPEPGQVAAFPQTLLVQPNLEILAYRQGLTPELIAALTRCATWKGLGAACTLQLEPHSVYRALEAGETFDSLLQMFERHGMKPVPPSVLDSLRTWSNKRDRISLYPAGALFEFPGPAELADALARGLPAVRLTDRLAIVPNESAIDYRHFRLTGTRDYCLPPEKCIDVEADGVTLSIDLARSDLLLETEVQGLAEPLTRPSPPGRRLYGLTPASLAAARQVGWTLLGLESWFQQRTGQPLSAAAVLLFSACDMPPQELRRQLVLHAATPLAADGLMQWPPIRALIQQRLGPTALAVAQENVEELRQRCRELGIEIKDG